MSKPTLGVMSLYLNANHHLEERTYFRKLIVQGNKLGLQVIVFTPQDVDYKNDKVHAHLYDLTEKTWSRKWVGLPSVIYDRCRYQPNERFRQFQRFRAIYANKLIFLNRPIGNKWSVHQLLYRNPSIRPYLPVTKVYRSSRDITEFVKNRSLVYMKPINGTGGRGILRIEKQSSGMFLIQGRDRSRKIISPRLATDKQIGLKLTGWDLKDRYLIQQGIQSKMSDGRVHDFRLLIQKTGSGQWDVTGCAGRVGPKRSITSNLHGGGEAVPLQTLLRQKFTPETVTEITKEINTMSHAIAEFLEKNYGKLCELGLDIAVDPSGHPWLLEINPKPAREVFARIGEQDTYSKAVSRPLEYALWMYNGGKRQADSSSKSNADRIRESNSSLSSSNGLSSSSGS